MLEQVLEKTAGHCVPKVFLWVTAPTTHESPHFVGTGFDVLAILENRPNR